MKRRTFFSIGVLIAFFLPWVDLNFFTLSGYDIPTSLDKLSNLSKVFNSSDNSDVLKFSYLLYLIPVCSVFNIIKDITGYKGSYFLNEFLFGIIAVNVLFILINDINEKATSVLSIGYYLTSIFSVLGIFLFEKKKTSNEDEKISYQIKEEPEEISITTTDKTELLNQLSQLHSLKEKGVLTEDIYEQERQEILSKLTKQNITENTTQTEAREQTTSTIDEYNREYEELFGKETWFKRNKSWILIFSSISLLVTTGYFIFNNTKGIDKLIIGNWVVDSIYIKDRQVPELEYLKIMSEFKDLRMDFITSKNIELYKDEKEKELSTYSLNQTLDTLQIKLDDKYLTYKLDKVDGKNLIMNGPFPNFDQYWIFKRVKD